MKNKVLITTAVICVLILLSVAGLFTQKLMAQSNDTVSYLFSKAQIEERLEYLSSSPTPSSYWSCGNPPFSCPIISYICSTCGGETLYGSDSYVIPKKEFIQNRMGYFEPKFFNYEAYIIVYREIAKIRKEIQEVKGINISLDESEFCKYCSPYTTNPSLNLSVNIHGEPNTTTTPNVTCMDIQLLHVFLNWNLAKTQFTERDIARIKELLGIKE